MTDVPKIVRHKLRASVPEGSHPEADLLTAFAEQCLSSPERDSVLQHLALCSDCREVVSLALSAGDALSVHAQPEGEVAPLAAAPARTNPKWFAWANLGWAQLRWATLAAGIAVAVLVLRPGLQQNRTHSQPVNSVASQSPAPTVPPASAAPVASGQVAVRDETTSESKTSGTGPSSEPTMNLASNAHRAKLPAQQTALQGKVANNLVANNLKKENAPAANNAFEYGALSPSDSIAANKTDADSLMARADAPAIEKAKPALQDKDSEIANESQKTAVQKAMLSSSQPPPASQAKGGLLAMRAAAPAAIPSKPAPNWMIAKGALQRSVDNGQSWQTAVQTDHALLCYANRGNDVWAGGQAGTLMHSTDGGTTWSAVAVSSQGHPLSADVSRIDVRGASDIVLTTDNHETWSSTDEGKTWEKK